MKTIKYIVSIIIFLAGLGQLLNNSITAAILFVLLGSLIFPSINELVKKKVKIFNKKSIRFGVYAILLIIGAASIDITEAKEKYQSNKKVLSSESEFDDYVKFAQIRIKNLSEKNKESRTKLLSELRKTKTYIALIDSSVVSAKYLPVLTALNDGVRNFRQDNGKETFGLKQNLVDNINKLKEGKDKLNFVIKTVMLLTESRGNALPKEIISIIKRYRKKYKIYGVPSNFYNTDGEVEGIDLPYDMTSLLVILEPSNKNYLNKLYEAHNEGVSKWNKENEFAKYKYSFVATKKGYNSHVKEVYPDSPYVLNVDYEISAINLYREYEANEIAADNKYKNKKLAVTGVVVEISEVYGEVTVDLSTGDELNLTTIKCSVKNKKKVAELRKGQNVTIIGICDGLTLNLYVGMEKCEI
ncbi:OB-fold protein [Polaribacter porphyrae]|uniref:tRNA_anti-like n=1 Tax=Polaribacter porphyrae TaxID=1137780 RepID=A0A2S7WP61_9FLAO|nr:hypothetical protein [Polaribacter porphyrae]PQJ79397.1 hypothetical protein BTO18_09530 [Polaribacter porphyrae]